MKMLPCVLAGLTALASCSPKEPEAVKPPKKPAAVQKQAVVLQGTSKNTKVGAVLETADRTVSIHGLPAWPADALGRRLTLKGELHTLPPPPATFDAMGNVVQGILTPQYVLHGYSKVEPDAPK